MRFAIIASLFCLLTALPGHAATTAETMPLSDIKPGMKGEWRTTISGTAIQTFSLEVIGVMQNFIGPQHAVILCQATDPSQIENGPVAGMSGSPVYIDGKLIGAYAYGWTFPKNQAIIGVTPIADMLEVLNDPVAPVLPGKPHPLPTIPLANNTSNPADTSASPGFSTASGPGQLSDWRVTLGGDRLAGKDFGTTLTPLPTPLMVSGVSGKTLSAFKDILAKRGLELMDAPGGSASNGGPPASSLEPGSPMGVVLLDGDFSIYGVGTLTWRQDDKILAFGHPMFKFGSVDMPLATAEIVTILRSYEHSTKLANIGPIVGTISQDRLTAIGGTIGPKPPMTAFTAQVTAADGTKKTFTGNLWQNRQYAPVIGAMGLMQSLDSTQQAAVEQTYAIDTTIDLDGLPPIKLSNVASGPDGENEASMDFMDSLDELMSNPFETPRVKSLNFDIKLRDSWQMSSLESVRVDSGQLRAGEKLSVTISLANYRDKSVEQKIDIPIPESAAGETLTLFLGDASSTETLDRGGARRDFTSLTDVVNYLRQGRSRGALYVKLLQSQTGLRVSGSSLLGLPPSVEQLYLSPKNVSPGNLTTQTTLWETSIPVAGEFNGRFTMPLHILP
jgi:hypothetical protein